MIKAIIFDCFGVLAETSPDQFFQKFLSDKPEIVNDIKDLDNRVTADGISHEQYIDYVVEKSGCDWQTVEQYSGKGSQNLRLFDYIANELKPHYKIGFLSNAPGDWTGALFTSDQLELFDDFVLSYKTGIRKPDPEIYKIAVGNLGCKPSECLMVDDVQLYLDGADKAGLRTVLYSNFDSFQVNVEEALG